MSTNQNDVSGKRSSTRNRTQSARARGDDPLSTLVQPPKKSDAPVAPPPSNDDIAANLPSIIQPGPDPIPIPAPVGSASPPKKRKPKKRKKSARKGPTPSFLVDNVSPQISSPVHEPSESPASPIHPTLPSPSHTPLVHSPVLSSGLLSLDDYEGSSNKENHPPILPPTQKARKQPGRSASSNAAPLVQHYDPWDSPPSEDDYGLNKDLKRRQNASKPRPSPTTSESDIALDEEFLDQAQPSPVPSPGPSPVVADFSDNGSDLDFEEEFDAVLEQFKKDYRCEAETGEEGQGVDKDAEGDAAEKDDEDVEMDEEDGDVEGGLDEDLASHSKHKAGPLSDIAKESADGIFKACIDKLEALARQEGKSVTMLYRHVGLNTVSPRGRNNWNLYQLYLRANHGEQFKHLSGAQWTKAALRRYKKFLAKADAGEGREKAFAPIFAWYDSRLTQYIAHQNKEGKMGKLTVRLLKPFIDLAVKVYQDTGIEIFGYAVNPERDSKGGTSSVSWGGTPGFLEVRAANEPNIIKTLQDLETMFHMRIINQVSTTSPPELIVVQWDQKGRESVRDRDSRVLKEYVRKDSVMILVARADGGLDERATVVKSRFPWSRVLDFTYRKRMHLVGWPDGYAGDIFQIESLPAKTRRELAQRRKDYEDGKCDETGVLRVVPWTDDEVSLCEQDLDAASTIPLIQDAMGTHLRSVKHSEAYIEDVDQSNGVKSRKMKTTSKATSGSRPHAANAIAPPSSVPVPVNNLLGSPFTLHGDHEGLSDRGGSLFGSDPPTTPTFQSSLGDDGVVGDYIHTLSSSPPLEGFGDQDHHFQSPNTVFMSPPPPSSLHNHINRSVTSRNPSSHSGQGATQRLSHLLSQPARPQPIPRPASHQSNNHPGQVARPHINLNTNRSVSAVPQARSLGTAVNPLIRSRSPVGPDDGARVKRQRLEQELQSYPGGDMASKQLRAAIRAEINQLDDLSFSGAVTARPRPRQVQRASTSFTPFEAQFASPGPSQQTQMTTTNRSTSHFSVGPQRNSGQSRARTTRR
ncbi:hypothetical protein BDN72DRAFT_864640 [Pluteus cervinus]|uniref:Uncharacterized protein n=1 Tax=Pluteus cervinus TaxID=181527 RepID=A0ACD3A3H5_9AGAR|nr:hypothetical protein BDN72DRAFT_864640 [Pluteus cervinus]